MYVQCTKIVHCTVAASGSSWNAIISKENHAIFVVVRTGSIRHPHQLIRPKGLPTFLFSRLVFLLSLLQVETVLAIRGLEFGAACYNRG